ncbi:MAG TPA: M48 family metalloprotease [Chthonomonadaceae bacterium]|nr:M48 family metalloprotease [Chthonomonadaceae bacterium]
MLCARLSASSLARAPHRRATVLLSLLLAALWSVPSTGYAGQTTPSPAPPPPATSGSASPSAQQGTTTPPDSKPDRHHGKARAAPSPPEDPEVKLGREAAAETDKHSKLITDPVLVGRVNRIGQELAEAANTYPTQALFGTPEFKKFHYTFKIIDDKDVNAFSLPGGYIYLYKGLLDYVHSDDELAGVMAHEITHAAHHHLMKLMHEQNKIQNVLLPLIAMAAIIGRGGLSGSGELLEGSQLYTLAKVNSYTMDAEKDADHGAILLLTHTHFNPAGLYSCMLRMAADERSHPQIELGIYRTHPTGPDRVEAARQLLADLNIPIHLTEVDPTLQAVVTPINGLPGGQQVAEIKMRGIVLCRVVATDGLTAEQRGLSIARRLNSLVDAHLQSFEIRVNPEKTAVLARGFTILTEADASGQNKSLTDMAHDLSDAILLINQKQQLDIGTS